ncbi:MAG: cysteine desulfurase family protein [Patescibacteria group bacterium]
MLKTKDKIIDLDAAAGADNPSSIHRAGARAARRLDEARRAAAEVLGAHPDEIVFTSGGTEANNLAIFGTINFAPNRRQHIITSVIEHVSVLEPCRELKRRGAAVTYLPVNREGLVSSSDLARALRPETRLVSIGYANNEIGTVQPLRELARVIRNFKKLKPKSYLPDPLFHTDACQAPGFLDCRVSTLGVDLLTLNSNKVGGSPGVGCLYMRRGVQLSPLLYGGGQEHGRRSGTENVPGIVEFAVALTLAVKSREKESARLTKLRDYFLNHLLKWPGVILNGSRGARLPNNINVSFAGTDSEFVVLSLDAAGVLCSSGSACSTNDKSSSHVISAIGTEADTTIRFTLGPATTQPDLDHVLKILPDILRRGKKIRPTG